MSRGNSGGYGHWARATAHSDEFVIGWKWDRHYTSSRLRFPQSITRDTNRKGAERFAKRHGITIKPYEGMTKKKAMAKLSAAKPRPVKRAAPPPDPDMPTSKLAPCHFCKKATDVKDCFCYGCKKVICNKCDVCMGNHGGHGHSPNEHRVAPEDFTW